MHSPIAQVSLESESTLGFGATQDPYTKPQGWVKMRSHRYNHSELRDKEEGADGSRTGV
jgi:hypothetical protein